MDVNQVLEGTLSPDDSVRQSSEAQLTQAAEADFSGYLVTLGKELANEATSSQVRMAAALALKNSFSARDFARLRQVQERWLTQVDGAVKQEMRSLSLKTLSGNDNRVGSATAQFIASIATIDMPRGQWDELMPALMAMCQEASPVHSKQAALTAIGYICDVEDAALRENLTQHSNSILTCVVTGARKEEPSQEVRYAAVSALSDSLEFIRNNFEAEGERNFIMQVVCEATQASDARVQAASYGCLNRIMGMYYDKMRLYMEKALFGLTIMGMKNDDEDVAKLAIEFWCTVCEEEIAIEDDNAQAQSEGSTELRAYFNFARVATHEIVPVLLELLAKQDEDATDDEYNTARAAYQCLQLFASAVGSQVVPPVLQFVEKHLRSEDWHYRDAAVSAFGAIMEGPEESMLMPLVKQALPVLIAMMDDPVLQVKDSAAYALGRICEVCSDAIDPSTHLTPLISSLFQGLSSNPRMASSCCWALMNLAERFAGDAPAETNELSQHFQASVSHILQVTERSDADNHLRTAAYEVLNAFVTNAANDVINLVGNLSGVILERLEKTIALQQQVVSVEDKITLEEMQTSLASVVISIIGRLEAEIKPLADRIMQVLLQLLQAVGGKTAVPETVFTAIGSLANALEDDFIKYMEAFTPYLYNALGNLEEPGLCSIAIGLVSDISRSMNEKVQPYCDSFMNYLLQDLQSANLGNQFKPAILQCFGDIAQAIGPAFESYFTVVAQVLQQAQGVKINSEATFDLIDYIESLREGIMDAWDGAIVALKIGGKQELLMPFIESIIEFLKQVHQDPSRAEPLMRSAMGVIGDLADAFPNGEINEVFRQEFLTEMARETRANHSFSPRTKDTARWAREQIKRQVGMQTNISFEDYQYYLHQPAMHRRNSYECNDMYS
ncbi:ARM repeat-containing protein [Pseudovirgaria hyperparasitica]|uniref:Importin-95 n=1 Tax=Pseudovirgaria hyperparasitica TaxID=470096 RepID=A0A6A6W4T1_9PEZI|nr:ARM repeat-containing protein [Pseudovirgaria hyperparasitica]KAF2756966.1 ARM repeat-containing protein [Pseudovirgaria hyperparasitica]